MTWTHFWDMHSGGDQKLDAANIYIEAPEEEAKVIFYNRLGRNPERVSCTCCGEDYSISEHAELWEATHHQRGGGYDKDGHPVDGPPTGDERFPSLSGAYVTLPDYLQGGGNGRLGRGKPIVIYAADIKPEERRGEVPEEGYVWA